MRHNALALLLVFLLLPLASKADDVRVTLTTSHAEAIALFRKHHAVDISTAVGVKRRLPLKNTFWEFQNDGIVIELIEKEGKIEGLSYWSKADFSDKIRRSETEQRTASLSIDTATGRMSVEKDQQSSNTNEILK